ncbi:MAG: ABC transporter permease [Ferrovibrionaceae bacterium]
MSGGAPRTPVQRFWTGVLYVTSAAVLFFLLAPILAIVPLSVNESRFLTYPMTGLSGRWYADLGLDPRWGKALVNSLIIGVASTALSMVLGTLAAIGLNRARFPGHGVVTAIVLSPMIVPVVISSVGFYLFYAPLGLTGTYLGLILGHTALAVPFVVVTVSATLAGFDHGLMRAAANLGASPVTAFRRVMMPLIAPGLAAGALFAFATSLDEVVMVLMVAGPDQRTLPREMFSGIRENISPTITAIATILIVLAVALLATLEALRRRGERLKAGDAA